MYFDILSFQYTQILFAQTESEKKDLNEFYILFLDKFQAFEENLY